ncbi:hypothetical protein RAHE111665_16650 [Rariglobus hedericola]
MQAITNLIPQPQSARPATSTIVASAEQFNLRKCPEA